MGRRAIGIGVVALAVAVLLGVSWQRRSGDEEVVAYTYCVAFGDLEPDLAEVVRILDGKPRHGDLDLATLQGSAALLWTEEVARRGPDRIDRQSVVVAKAVREALRSDDAAGLRRPAVAEAVEQITPVARNACEGHGLRGR